MANNRSLHTKLSLKATRCAMRAFNAFIGAYEFAAGFTTDERPDGFAYFELGSILIEAKTSRPDFLKDQSKPCRAPGKGIGRYRYYAAPKGLLTPEDLPAKWGLIEMAERNKCTIVWGMHSQAEQHPLGQDADYLAMMRYWQFNDRDLQAENQCLAYLAKRYKTQTHMANIL